MTELTGERLRRKIGNCLGAINDIPSLMLRVKVDEDTGCWVWQASFTGGRATVPTAYFRDGSYGSVPRWAYEQVRGPLPNGWMVWRTCDCKRCVNPEHMNAGTRKAWGYWLRQTKAWKGDMARVLGCKKGAASRRVLTEEVMADVRGRGETAKEASERLGVSIASVYRAFNRTAHVDGASVFSWRP